MKHGIAWLCGLSVLATAGRAPAHYHILLPDKASADRDAAVHFTLRFGHPFEHQMFATQKPISVVVVTPDGHAVGQSDKLERYETPGANGKPAAAYRWTYTPGRRGDHVVFVRCEPVWMAEEMVFLEDTVKVVLHVQTQNGWDAVVGGAMELVPLTRPYGVRGGTVFQVTVRQNPALDRIERGRLIFPGSELQRRGKTLVEVERYNSSPPKELPPDEFITRTARTDPSGVATVTLPEPGWWAITAITDGGMRVKDGKSFPVKTRSTIWVPVADKSLLLPAK